MRNANHVETFTLSVGGTGCPLRIRWSRSSWLRVRSKCRSKVDSYLSKRSNALAPETDIVLSMFSIRDYQSTMTPNNSSNLLDENFFERSFGRMSQNLPTLLIQHRFQTDLFLAREQPLK